MTEPEQLTSLRKHPLAKCEDCPLYAEGQFVPSDGPAKAKLAIVGEAPGANEARIGRPFIGESGKLLDTILRHYQINRKEVLLSNACLCREANGATPSAKALQACRPRLLAELKDRNVEDVVALGNSSAQSILATKVGITTLRIGQGRTNEIDLPDVRVVATFHPAACLRVPDFFPSLVSDFGKLKGFSGVWYEPKWKAYDDVPTALQALAELQKIPGPVVVDIESNIEKDVSFENPTRHELLCVGLGYAPGKVVVIGETACHDEAVLNALRLHLSTHPIDAQNGKFDLKGLWAKLDFNLFKLHFDTMLANYCQDERQGVHRLDYQGIEKLGAPNWKHELDKYLSPGDGYGVIPRQVLYKYNAWDVHVTALLRDMHQKILIANGKPEPVRRRADGQLWGLVELQEFLCRASDQLAYAELNGIGIDSAYNKELAISYAASLAILEERIANAIPGRLAFNPRSPKQVKEVVKEEFHLKLPMKMNQKREYAETTDADALEGLLEQTIARGMTSAEEFFRRMLEHRKEAKLYGTYVKGLRKRMYRGRVYPTFLLHGTTTGRLSCRNPNLQNIPRDSTMRRQFVPCKPENVFIEGDYCLSPETRILKKDLTWDTIDNLKAGDELIGFREEDTSYMEPTRVTKTGRLTKPCYEITLQNGKKLISSHDHLWVARYSSASGRTWIQTSKLKAGQSLLFYVEPWEVDDSRDGGWLAGFLDGEGSLDRNSSGKWDGVKFGQNDGLVASKACSLLQKRGYSAVAYGTSKCKRYKISGPPRTALRLVGQLRPERFLARSEDIWLGRTSCTPHKIISVKHIGEQEVIAVQTSTHTLVAEGYLTHNCQNELRVLCWLAQDEYLRGIFNDPTRDLFDELTPILYGNVSGLTPAQMKELRIRVKAYVYGLAYGREAMSIAMEFGIPMSEAQRGMTEFFKVIPQTVAFRERTRQSVLKGNDLITPYGRHRRFWLITNQNRKDVLNEALAFLPQSTASDICLDAFIHIRPRLKGIGFIRNIVHDSILAECHPDRLQEVATTMNEEMLESARRIVGNYVAFKVDLKSGPNWGDLNEKVELAA